MKIIKYFRHKVQMRLRSLIQKYYKYRVINTMNTEFRSCILCDSKDFLLIYEKDRYNIPLKTQRCKKCGLMMVNPTPTSEFLKEFYSSKMYRGLYLGILKASERNNARAYPKAQVDIAFIEHNLDLPESSSVLDVGSAYGAFLVELKRKNPRYRVYGIEPGGNFSQKNMSKLHGLYNTVNELPPHQKFDLIALWHVLEHLYEPVQMLHLLRAHMKETSFLLIEVPDINKYEGIRNIHIGHICHFSRETISNILEKTGFSCLVISDDFLQDKQYGMKIIAKIN